MRPSSSATRPRRRCARQQLKQACPFYSESIPRRRCARTRGPTASPTRSRVCFLCPFFVPSSSVLIRRAAALAVAAQRRGDGVVVAAVTLAATARRLEVRSRVARPRVPPLSRGRHVAAAAAPCRREPPPQTRPPSSTSRRRRPSRTARSSSSTRPRPARAGVPFYYTKNGPGTIRCGFTDSTESAAQRQTIHLIVQFRGPLFSGFGGCTEPSRVITRRRRRGARRLRGCRKRAPFFVRSWSLATDDCARPRRGGRVRAPPRRQPPTPRGVTPRLFAVDASWSDPHAVRRRRLRRVRQPDERMASPWWARHARPSPRGSGRLRAERRWGGPWGVEVRRSDEASMHPAVLAQRSLRAASQAGWLPDLSAKPALPPCLRAPAADFALGDDTAPPSAAPPPPPPVPQDWPFEAAAPSGRVAAALGGFGCGALLMMMVAMASRKRGAATGYEAV